jgi:hypothetical protein
MNMKSSFRVLVAAWLLAISALPARAQWITQSMDLKAGWNAVFLHVDASYITLDQLVGADLANPIQEIWVWNPSPSTAQYVESPQAPTGTGSQWLSWLRSPTGSPDPRRLIANTACLVRISASVPSYTWNLKGKPVSPRYNWTTTGLNFLGFPTLAGSPPSFETFLAQAPDLQLNAQIFQYSGGELGVGNPARLYALRTTPVRRGEAFWIRSGDYFNRYFSPFELVLQSSGGVQFGDSLSQYRFRLKNLTVHVLTVTATLLPSEGVPSGQPAVVGTPPLLLRGTQNLTNLTYGHASFSSGALQWTLQPAGQVGSEAEVVLGINRSEMSGNAGDLYGGILRLTDSLNFSQVDMPVSATVASTAGLWVGSVVVDQVQHYLKSYAKNTDGSTAISPSGAYVKVDTNTSLGSVSRPFPLRLILHRDGAGKVVLLQRVYTGVGMDTNPVVAIQESSLLKAQLPSARRISAVHLPWSAANQPWPCLGELRSGTNLTATIDLAYDDSISNPFLHTYHPDHDNLNATFTDVLPLGEESYGISRQITLTLTTPAGDFASVTSGSQTMTGIYGEAVELRGKTKPTGTDSRQFEVRGGFILQRISDISTLTTP